jgi:dolichol-phosphate mannosyltransferase
MRILVAVPVYNEQRHVTKVLQEIRRYVPDVLVIDDGSTDETPLLLARQPVEVIRHATNRGYGRSIRDAFRWAQCYRHDWLITMDCDEQHEPAALPQFIDAMTRPGVDVLSGSRYLAQQSGDDQPPADRRAINATVTDMVNRRLGLSLTDSFCGFKAYRVASLKPLDLSEDGYAFPLQFWVQAVAYDLTITEVPIRLIYNDPNRSFGGPLDDAEHRLRHYRDVFEREVRRFADRLPAEAAEPCACTAGQMLRSASSRSAPS